MTVPNDSGHIADLLPAYLNRSLTPAEHDRVERHLQSCPGCQGELKEWRAISGASLATANAVPPPSRYVLERVRSRIEQLGVSVHAETAPGSTFGVQYLWQLLLSQFRLVRKGIWIAVPVTMAAGCLVALSTMHPESSRTVLAMLAPVVAAVSLSLIYGPDNDPSLELALSTATSPRLVLLARMTLVFSYDLLLAVAASTVIAATVGGTGLWLLIELWIGPMLFLSALALALSLLFSSSVAISTAVALWAIRVYALNHTELNQRPTTDFAELVNTFWGASPILVALFVCITLGLLTFVPQRERFA